MFVNVCNCHPDQLQKGGKYALRQVIIHSTKVFEILQRENKTKKIQGILEMTRWVVARTPKSVGSYYVAAIYIYIFKERQTEMRLTKEKSVSHVY